MLVEWPQNVPTLSDSSCRACRARMLWEKSARRLECSAAVLGGELIERPAAGTPPLHSFSAAHDDMPVRAGVAPSGVNREDHARSDENLAGADDPRGRISNAHAFADGVAQEEKSDHDHLRCGLGFSGGIGGEDGAVRERQLTQPSDEKVARDQNDRGPRGNVVRPSEANERGGDENFVRERIHQPAEIRLALHATRDEPVEVIGKNGQTEGDGGDGRSPGHAAFPRRDKKNGEKEADDGELVGEGHDRKGAKVAKGRRKGKGGLTEEKRPKWGSGKDFLNVRLNDLSDILRTWRSGPQGSLEKILRFFQKGG